jgi:two-component system chemotaxis response regulator CheY
MDGFSFLQILRQKERPLASIPALVTSTESAEADFAAARTAGANYYLVKPIDRERLVQFAAMFCGVPL